MDNRVLLLNKTKNSDGNCVIYFVSRDIRISDNFALIIAQQKALELLKPLVVCFALDSGILSRSREHFQFLLTGLEEFANELDKYHIPFILRTGSRQEIYSKIIKELRPSAIFFDFSPLNKSRLIQKKIASQNNIPVSVVDAHNIVPVWLLSQKEEFSAHSLRFKVTKMLSMFLSEPTKLQVHKYKMQQKIKSTSFNDANNYIASIPSSGIKISFSPGESAAKKQLEYAITNIVLYASERNDPNSNTQTGLSPYLHFGFISSLRVVLDLSKIMSSPPLLTMHPKLARSTFETPNLEESCNVLIEEIVVRKELAENYCFYNSNYNNLLGAKPWALNTLAQAELDTREHIYSIDELENCLTADPAWNAAQKQMKKTGKMHGYMRMYWAKKILEWSVGPEQAIKTANYLNDKYSIDGGDPNGYTGVAWSIMGIHDRPWFKRPIFGKIRYMNYQGLGKKFNLKEYEKKWNNQ